MTEHPLAFTTVRRTALGLLTALLLSACATPSARKACPSGRDVRADMLHGVWQVHMAGMSAPGTLHLGPHPEHTGSLRGELVQGLQRWPVVADVDDGEFTLEESRDGLQISATWLGTPTTGHCGRLIEGQRFEKDPTGQNFRLLLTQNTTPQNTAAPVH
jgi:hypothetical protein